MTRRLLRNKRTGQLVIYDERILRDLPGRYEIVEPEATKSIEPSDPPAVDDPVVIVPFLGPRPKLTAKAKKQ